MKGEIASLGKDFDTATCTYYWSAVVWFEDKPNLKLGNCEIKQKEV